MKGPRPSQAWKVTVIETVMATGTKRAGWQLSTSEGTAHSLGAYTASSDYLS